MDIFFSKMRLLLLTYKNIIVNNPSKISLWPSIDQLDMINSIDSLDQKNRERNMIGN